MVRDAVMLAFAVGVSILAMEANESAARGGKPGGKTMALTLTSTVFSHEEEIPSTYSCQGKGGAPPLAWSGAPAETRSFVIIVHDPDAPDPAAPRKDWVHWLVYNLPATTTQLSAGPQPALPPGTMLGLNDSGRAAYGPPCPPIGRHRYFYQLYALDTMLPDLGTPQRPQLEEAMKGHVLAEAVLMGTYQKQGK